MLLMVVVVVVRAMAMVEVHLVLQELREREAMRCEENFKTGEKEKIKSRLPSGFRPAVCTNKRTHSHAQLL